MAEVFVLLQNPIKTAGDNIILAHANTSVVARAIEIVTLRRVTRTRVHVEEPSYMDSIIV